MYFYISPFRIPSDAMYSRISSSARARGRRRKKMWLCAPQPTFFDGSGALTGLMTLSMNALNHSCANFASDTSSFVDCDVDALQD